jgi:hypothetical protein
MTMKKIPLFLILASSMGSPAQEVKPPTPQPDIRVEVQIVTLPQAKAIALVRDFKDPAKSTGAYAQLQEMLEKDTATLLGWPILTTKDGNRAVCEANDEFRFPTEFDSGGIGFYFDRDGIGMEPEKGRLPKKIKGVDVRVTPTTFETRNLGVSLEVEPSLAVGGKISLDVLGVRHVRLKSIKKITVETEKHAKVIIEQPDFEDFHVTTNLNVSPGEHMLIGTFKATEPAGNLELFVLTAEVRKTP